MSPEPGLQMVVAGATESSGQARIGITRAGLIRITDIARTWVTDGGRRSDESSGQASSGLPVQDSSGSQMSPEPGLQMVVAGATESSGQARIGITRAGLIRITDVARTWVTDGGRRSN